MGIDQRERQRRAKVDQPAKRPGREPIAAIEKRVIDSAAFCALSASAKVTLLLFARYSMKDQNGNTFVSCSNAEEHGVSKKTFYRSLKELSAHGLIFQTKRSGHGVCGRYALTWIAIKDKRGLRLDNFDPNAWKNWSAPQPKPRKKRGVKMTTRCSQISPSTPAGVAKFTLSLGDKFTQEKTLNANRSTPDAPHIIFAAAVAGGGGDDWMAEHVAHLAAHGLAGRECFILPSPEVEQ